MADATFEDALDETIDATYADTGDASVKIHQTDHDWLHALANGPNNIVKRGAIADDPNTNNLPVLQGLADEIDAAGGGTMFIPVGAFRYTGIWRIPSGVDVIGQSGHGSRVQPSGADSHVAVGSRGKGDWDIVSHSDGDAISAISSLVCVDDAVHGYDHLKDGETCTVILVTGDQAGGSPSSYTIQQPITATVALDTPSGKTTFNISGHSATGYIDTTHQTVWAKQEDQQPHTSFGNFKIQCVGGAEYGLICVGGANKNFTNMFVVDAAVDNVIIDGVQNCSFDHFQIDGAGDRGLVLDGGCKQVWLTDFSVDNSTNEAIAMVADYPNGSNPDSNVSPQRVIARDLHVENNGSYGINIEACERFIFESGQLVTGGNDGIRMTRVADKMVQTAASPIEVYIGGSIRTTSGGEGFGAYDPSALGGTGGTIHVLPTAEFASAAARNWYADAKFDVIEHGPLIQRVGTGGTMTALVGATDQPEVTGSAGGNAALASLLTALESYGLITDSST